ncbi:DUF4012 domain-containing protein [Microbacterium sp. NPDC058342]|uniref:DUF4012 domain-containing protein n=1 Tax=Microbacterium sp. NPDC058342 TaxID=3346454 RepID=UPI00364F761B
MSRGSKGLAITDSNAPRTRRERRYDGTLADLDPDLAPSDDDADEPRRRRRWPWVVLAIFLLLVAAAVFAGIFLIQALQVKDDLQAAKSRISKVVPLMKEGDADAVEALSKDVLKYTSSADETVGSPLWQFASAIPWVGANVTAVSETTQATHVLVRDALPLALELIPLADPDNFKVEGGGINLEPFRVAQPQLPALRGVFDEAKSHIDRIDLDAIHPFVKENIGQLVDVVDQATPAIAFAEKNLPMLLAVLGDDGPRNYALLFQNNAEIRATGGNPGAGAVLHVENGKVRMRTDAAALRFVTEGPRGWHPQSLPDASKMTIFETDTWKYSQNYTRTPDFADTAHMMSGLWSRTAGGRLDGIISVDPVALSYMLEVAGSVSVAGESTPVTADNAVKLLLSDTYERFGSDGRLADAYFAKVSAAVFSKIMSGGWDPVKMLEQMQKAADEQRVYAWFADEGQAAMAAELGIDGEVTADNKGVTQTGIFLNDASHSKLEYYLTTKLSVTCSAEKRTMTTTIEMHNSIPGADLSSYTLGQRNSSWGYPRTTMFLDVIGMALPGGELAGTAPKAGERDGWDRTGTYNGRQAKSLFVTLAKDETKKVSFTSTVPKDATAPLEVRYSPTVTQTPVTIDDSCSSMFPAP